MKKVLKVLTHRSVLVAFALLIQILALVIVIIKFNDLFIYFYAICVLLSLIAVLYIINKKTNPSYKMAWIIPILLFPIFGGLFYLLFGGNKLSKRYRKKMQAIKSKMSMSFSNEDAIMDLKQDNLIAFKQANYIQKEANAPIYKNSAVEYLSSGEKMFAKMKEELQKAQHYIFLEYFIVEEGIMWNSILEILVQKVKAGLDVRVMYDDMGSIMTLPYKYYKKLEDLGIKCCAFNPFIPILSSKINNRDHRKMMIIDGHTGFTGGINLADEYINLYPKYGYWKDSGVLIQGAAVWNLTVMFLSIWDYCTSTNENYDEYRPSVYQEHKIKAKGYVQPYNDSPLDDETVGENVYLNLIHNASKCIYITTPYLIIDNEMITALTLASKSGVDVRIITPGIPDKKIVNELTKSYYETLIADGVKIYEYNLGFMHAKNFVVDDLYATVGTINMDYRSLYLHFECGVWMYGTSIIKDIKEDFITTLENCREITLKDCKKVSKKRKLFRAVLKVLAPLM